MPSKEEIAAQKAVADKEAADAKAKADADAAAEAAKKEEGKAGDVGRDGKMVPEWQLLEAKKSIEEKLGKKIADLEAVIEKSKSKAELSGNLDDIYEAYPEVDKKFIDLILAKATKAAEAKIEPITKEREAAESDKAFDKAFKFAMNKLGKDFEGIVNADVIKELTKLPKNSQKTFSEIIEETYGASLSGKRTIETTKPGGGKEPAPLDFDKARKDGKYFDEVMADPKLKKEYNDKMLEKGF